MRYFEKLPPLLPLPLIPTRGARVACIGWSGFDRPMWGRFLRRPVLCLVLILCLVHGLYRTLGKFLAAMNHFFSDFIVCNFVSGIWVMFGYHRFCWRTFLLHILRHYYKSCILLNYIHSAIIFPLFFGTLKVLISFW